jgi:hypothetical protein
MRKHQGGKEVSEKGSEVIWKHSGMEEKCSVRKE